MQKIFTFFYLLLICLVTAANPVNESTARKIGRAFITGYSKTHSTLNSLQLQLVYKVGGAGADEKAISANVYFYVFNLLPAKGFVIVAGDDAVLPILAYSTETSFNPKNIPENASKWLEGYKGQIRFAVAARLQQTATIKEQWQRLNNNSTISSKPASIMAVNPLVQTKWNQAPNYNELCPGGSVTGCVATAMAQVMKYWKYPASGTGFHSYNPTNNGYGTLSANFGNTTYDWGAMPLQVTGANNAVATLMYHAGVSVDMSYSPESSGAYVISAQSPVTNCAEYALKTYFGYRPSLQGVQRASYSDAQWIGLIKAELDASRPIIYAGFGNGGGHCFVTDGYDNNNFFHFNWGWNGSFDGYFTVNALNPGGVGIGGGSGGYNSGQQAVIGIQPPAAAPQQYNMQLYNYVTASAPSIYYGQSFTVSANIVNAGNGTFNGDYCAAVFDNANNFVDYIEIKTGASLGGGFHYTNDIVFSSTGIVAMLPASYIIGVYYRPTGGNWTALANSGLYTNSAAISVTNPNDIEIYTAISTNPAGELTTGDPVSVSVNILNNGTATFTGKYAANLYNLDGSFAQTIGVYNELAGLPSGYTYLSPYLNFYADSITVAPGTYLMAILHQPANGNFQITGSSYFQNPVKVIVKAAATQPDAYEVNNTADKASALPLTFTGNTASIKTSGANCHVSSDVDYYKVVLPAGFNYSILPRLHDSYSSADGQTYTLDALFTYSTDGVNWSEAFDDVTADSVTLSGGQTIYLKVAPYFVGTTGTYSLDIKLTKKSFVFAWTGAISTDWSNTKNWSASRLPTAADDIVLPAGTQFMPLVPNGITATCKSLRVAKGSNVTVSTGGALVIAGQQ